MTENHDLTDLEILVLCAIYRHVGFAVGPYTLTWEGAKLASQICAAKWDEIRDRLKKH